MEWADFLALFLYDAFFFEFRDGVFHLISQVKGDSPLWLCNGNHLVINVELYCVILQFSHTVKNKWKFVNEIFGRSYH